MPTIDDLKAYLWITWNEYDAVLQLFLDSASSYVESYIGRWIKPKEYTKYINGNWQLTIVLDNYPIISITSFDLDQWTIETPDYQPVDANRYRTDDDNGTIMLTAPQYRGLQNYRINYRAWYVEFPWDLKLAILKLASSYYSNRNSDGIKKEVVDGDSIEYEVSQIPTSVMSILDQYRDL